MKKCTKCGELHPADDHCPLCGKMAGVSESITNIPRFDFKTAREKLREETKEGWKEDLEQD
jgi:rRNA maturation protein Nop10